MIIDTHVHIDNGAAPQPDRLLRSMDQNGIDRTVLLAEEPLYFEKDAEKRREWNRDRLERLTRPGRVFRLDIRCILCYIQTEYE